MDTCNKYKELFIKENESELLEHIKTCKICKKEHEKMEKVSKVINEVSFIIRRQKQLMKQAVSIAASVTIFALAFFAVEYTDPNSFVNDMIASADYTYEQMGLPVDEYGLIMVDSDY